VSTRPTFVCQLSLHKFAASINFFVLAWLWSETLCNRGREQRCMGASPNLGRPHSARTSPTLRCRFLIRLCIVKTTKASPVSQLISCRTRIRILGLIAAPTTRSVTTLSMCISALHIRHYVVRLRIAIVSATVRVRTCFSSMSNTRRTFSSFQKPLLPSHICPELQHTTGRLHNYP
jgi:hypothetical protein